MTHEEIYARLESYKDLKEDWNGYGAKPLPSVVIEKAISLVPLLGLNCGVFPTGRESIQFEYEDENYYVELEVFSDKIETFSVLEYK